MKETRAQPMLGTIYKREEDTDSNHGKHEEVRQRRTQNSETHSAQEDESRKAEEGSRLRAWIEEAEDEEDGARPGEALSRSSLLVVFRRQDPKGAGGFARAFQFM
jgi:tRNA A37 methylthiotransferase MiaB